MNHSKRWVAALATLALAGIGARAAVNDEPVELDALEVTDVPIEENIMPTSRPFDSVFGTPASIVETPRNVTIISRAQLDSIAIQDVRDFAKLTSSSYTRSNFGAPGNPDIRGQYGDVFINGMRERTTSNGNGMPIDFNAVESVNIVKGPATAVQGASAYVGGFVDLVTKRPYFDKARGEAYATIGSYGIYRFGVDFGRPVSDKLAYRISYSGDESDGYFYDSYSKKHSLYAGVTFKPNDTYELFVNAQAFYAEYTENFGVNRPTQNLIDNGLYRTGININNGAGATPSDPQNSQYVTSGFPANVMQWGPEVELDRRLRLLRPGDNSMGRNFKLQAIQTFKTAPDLTIVNNTLFTYTRRDTFSSYYYTEIIDPAWTAETRLELQKSMEKGWLNGGIAFRYTDVKAYNDYFFEPAAVWDITRDRNFINVYNSVNFPGFGSAFAGGPVPGWPGRYGSSQLVNGDSNISSSGSWSPFVQSTWHLSDAFDIVAGGRVDFLHVRTRDPFTAGTERTIDVSLPNVNVSAVYKFTPDVSAYATYNYSENTSGATGNGGGFAGLAEDGAGGYFLAKSLFTQPSELFEVGAKASMLEDKLFLGAAVFEQTRQNKPQNSPVVTYRYRGFEIEANYQPTRRLFLTASYTLIDGSLPAANTGFEAINVSPVAAPEVQANSQTTGRVTVQGMPRNQFNALAQYKFDNGFGFSLNGTYHTEVNNNWAGTIVIPSQYEFDGSVFYAKDSWNVRLTVMNLTDEENWSPPNGTYGNESIVAEEGIRGELTFSYRF
jgi:outer membrane receptor protein involved in Fe transport